MGRSRDSSCSSSSIATALRRLGRREDVDALERQESVSGPRRLILHHARRDVNDRPAGIQIDPNRNRRREHPGHLVDAREVCRPTRCRKPDDHVRRPPALVEGNGHCRLQV